MSEDGRIEAKANRIGLGLAVTRILVNDNAGSRGVKSKVGQAAISCLSCLQYNKMERYMREKASILVVDDNIAMAKTMSFILEGKGYSVMKANDGPESIKKIQNHDFDIIFLDIKMPLMNGVETYKRIKKIKPDLMVVMMTAYAVEDLVQEALEEGVFEIMYKPLDIDKVINIIESARKKNKGALILVTDDDLGTRTTMKNILEKRSYKVGIARDGEEAIALVKKTKFDILFIDMKLPTLNGLETYLAIKKMEPEIIAIVMTGYSEEMAGLVDEAINNNAYACLYKPLNMEKVLRLIDEILK
jgi:DNA-binding NtrC family response regulator